MISEGASPFSGYDQVDAAAWVGVVEEGRGRRRSSGSVGRREEGDEEKEAGVKSEEEGPLSLFIRG